MRRVQSSIHGAHGVAGPTFVMQPASLGSESHFSRRRPASLVFTPCPSETPTLSNGFLQRAASSFCSATGWDSSAVGGEDDVAHGLEPMFANSDKAAQCSSFSTCCSNDEIENCSFGDEPHTVCNEVVSCFVACASLPMPAARSLSLEHATASPHGLLKSQSYCVAACNRLVNTSRKDVCDLSRPLGPDNWLGAALADKADPLPSSPFRRFSASVGASSSDRYMTEKILCAAISPATSSLPVAPSSEGEAWGPGEKHACRGLRRTRRVVRDMYRMAGIPESA